MKINNPFRRAVQALAATCGALFLLITAAVSPASAADSLTAGGALAPCTSLHSADGQYEAAMQCDGNLVVYGPGGPTWSSRTNGASGADLELQADGNLVIYASGHSPIWATGSTGANASLVMQNDGNLVLYGSGHALWASKATYEAAITWFYSRRGATNYEGQCELAAENAFGTSGRYPTARATWNARDHNFPYSSAPRGMLVFYDTSAAGHVAVSLGNGQVISTSVGGHIDIASVSYFQNPLGWGHTPW
jgi:hypothetical protein